jgi:CheY-like chemotaxis protein
MTVMQRVFVKVVGFSSVERHALNTVFRLSQDKKSPREWSYEPWILGSPAEPRLILIDGAEPGASADLQEAEEKGIGIIWVGSISPAKAFSCHVRPLKWPELLHAMDEYFTPRDGLDISLGGDTWPSVLESTGAHMMQEPGSPRALVADSSSTDRFYWRTKLSSLGITDVVEAATLQEARDALLAEETKQQNFVVLVLDMDLAGGDPWRLMDGVGPIRVKIATATKPGFSSRMSAKANGFTSLKKPLDPSRINELLAQFQ